MLIFEANIYHYMPKKENKLIKRRIVNAYLSSVISISLVLLLVGIASMILVNAKTVKDYFKEQMRISVLLKPEVVEDQALIIHKNIAKQPFVKDSKIISKQQGREEMAKMLGEDFLDVFESSPVPISVDLTLKASYVEADSLNLVQSVLQKIDGVDEVVYQHSLIEALNANINKISLILGVLITLLLFISFVLINNTMRLIIYSKRFSIQTMKLVGATKNFIRGPFLIKSAFLGLFSSLIAILLIIGILFIVRKEFIQLFQIFKIELLLQVMGIVVISGLIICILSTYLVVGRLVSLSKDDIYS